MMSPRVTLRLDNVQFAWRILKIIRNSRLQFLTVAANIFFMWIASSSGSIKIPHVQIVEKKLNSNDFYIFKIYIFKLLL